MVDQALRLWVVLARAFDAVERHSRASIGRFGLGSTEFGVLEALYHKGPLSVSDVRRSILLESGSTTYVVDKLVRRGLVRRASGPADRAAAMRRAVAGLAPRERAQARELLKKMGKSAAVTPSASEGPL